MTHRINGKWMTFRYFFRGREAALLISAHGGHYEIQVGRAGWWLYSPKGKMELITSLAEVL